MDYTNNIDLKCHAPIEIGIYFIIYISLTYVDQDGRTLHFAEGISRAEFLRYNSVIPIQLQIQIHTHELSAN